MLYAIVSDIHANLQAWEAVLKDIRAHQADEILCLGDIVDYGPAPAAVLQSVYAHCQHIITGNHDAALCGRTDSDSFNPRAQMALEWTRGQVDSKAMQVLGQLPLSMTGGGFRCVHGSPCSPSQYNYLLSPEDADPVWGLFSEQLCFVGHTHVPAVFFTTGDASSRKAKPADFVIEGDKRYIVNVGSVGQPRDGSVLASYCFYDTAADTVYFRQVAFDLDGFERELETTTIPKTTSGFLDVAHGLALPPVRELIDFSPYETATETSSEINVQQLEKKLHHWRFFGWTAALLMVLLTLSMGASIYYFSHSEAGTLYARKASLPLLLTPKVNEALLQPAEAIGTIAEDNRLQWLDVTVADPGSQFVHAESDAADDLSVFRLESQAPGLLSIRSLPAVAPPQSRFSARLQFKSLDVSDGFLEVLLVQPLAGGKYRILRRSEARIVNRKPRWYSCSTTLQTPLRGGEKVLFLVRGEFTGTVLLRKLQFLRIE